MRSLLVAIPGLVLAACADGIGDPPTPPPLEVGSCAPHDQPILEVANGELAYGELIDGADIAYGFPPQGGAPYVGFDLRVHGLDQDDSGLLVEITATDTSGAEMAYESYQQRFLCGNTGDNADWLVTSELHILFFGYEMEDLADVPVHFAIRAENVTGDGVDFDCAGTLRET